VIPFDLPFVSINMNRHQPLQDAPRWTTLHSASRNGEPYVVHVLLAGGANPNQKDNVQLFTQHIFCSFICY
jgi:ankyrin repeat protein